MWSNPWHGVRPQGVGLLARSAWVQIPCLFLLFFVTLILYRFLSKKRSQKCENRGFWLPKPNPKPSQNRLKIDVPQNMQFSIDFCSNFDVCSKSQHQKNVRPRSVLLAFHTIQCFAFCMRFRSKKPTKNLSKTMSEPFQNRCQKRVVSQHRFFRVSASILEGLGPPTWSQVGS